MFLKYGFTYEVTGITDNGELINSEGKMECGEEFEEDDYIDNGIILTLPFSRCKV